VYTWIKRKEEKKGRMMKKKRGVKPAQEVLDTREKTRCAKWRNKTSESSRYHSQILRTPGAIDYGCEDREKVGESRGDVDAIR
jgi:hypothetical protein